MVKSSAESDKSLLRWNYFTIIWANFQFIPNGVLFLLFASTERLICSEIYTRLISSWTDIPWVSPNPPFDVNDVISAHWVFYPSCNTSRKMMKLTYFSSHSNSFSLFCDFSTSWEDKMWKKKRLQMPQNTFKTLKKM